MALSALQTSNIVERLTVLAKARITVLDNTPSVRDQQEAWLTSPAVQKHVAARVLALLGLPAKLAKTVTSVDLQRYCVFDLTGPAFNVALVLFVPSTTAEKATIELQAVLKTDILPPIPEDLLRENTSVKACAIKDVLNALIRSPAPILSLVRLRWVPPAKDAVLPESTLKQILDDYIEAKTGGTCKR